MKRTFLFLMGAWLLGYAVVAHAALSVGQVLLLDATNQWMLAPDPSNQGKKQEWWRSARPEAKLARVPGSIQETLGEYHGVAWYWRTIKVPRHPHPDGRFILRFWSVDYFIEVWVNGQPVGQHECVDTMVEFDVTGAIRTEADNLVAVRLINPGNAPVEGFVIRECPGRNRFDPWGPGSTYNQGGILDSVELLLAAPVRVESLYLKPDWKTGRIEAEVNVRNATGKSAKGSLALSVAAAAGGETLDLVTLPADLPAGDTLLKGSVQVRDFQLWDLEHPVLYRVSARIGCEGSESLDEKSAQCGFRDFRFADGYFRLNGKRIFLKSAHFGGDSPLTGIIPLDSGMLRKDFLSMKMMGFNMARCIAGLGRRFMMDMADEIGFLVYDEAYSAWCVTPSPQMARRWNKNTAGMIRRDRNHPSVVIWGLLNETGNGPVFVQAANSLDFVKRLDDTRVVLLNSGRFDGMLIEGAGDQRQFLPEAWSPFQGFQVPFVARNSTGAPIDHDGTIFPAGALALHVGQSGEPAVIRFTARADGEYRVSVRFVGIAGPPAPGPATTGAGYVLAQGKSLFSDKINCDGRPNEASFEGRVTLKQGEVIDVVSASGNETFNSDTMRVNLAITGPDGVIHDATKDWSLANRNPNGVWTYGSMPPNAVDSARFAKFEQSFDGIRRSIGSLSNPGSRVWEDVLGDKHPYQSCPHTAPVIHTLRTIDGGGRPLFISEYGFGSANNLVHLRGHYAQASNGYAFDRKALEDYYRNFTNDWCRWRMADTFGNMENYFRQCVAMEAGGRLLGTSAIRSNPNVISHSLTACHDTVLAAEGLITSFREPKPGVSDAMWDAWAPLRFCVFAEPVQTVRGGSVHVEFVLVNEDVLRPGKYPARLQVIGPDGYRALDTSVSIEVPKELTRPEPPFAKLILAKDVKVDGPAGAYKAFAFFEEGASAEGGEYTFWVDEPAAMPKVDSTVTLWGQDQSLARWLEAKGIKTQPFGTEPRSREVILVGKTAGSDFGALTARIEAGATAVFLCPAVFAKGNQPTALLPLKDKGSLAEVNDWLYENNDWARNHPIFKGLPSGLLDYQFYREILGNKFFSGQSALEESVAGMINTSINYSSGLTVAVHRRGAGLLVLNSLHVRENLSLEKPHPVAERLLRNLLNWAAGVSK